jgi:hypothetical protein
MQGYWFCDACKSMNRAGASVCYRCRRPPTAASITSVRRQAGTVLTPGLDEEHRSVAWTLMARHRYFGAWRLGYVTAAALLMAVPATMLLSLIGAFLVIAHLGNRVAVLGNQMLPLYVYAAAGTMLATIILHSLFLGLASADAPALGCGDTRFGPLRGALWWIESYLWVLRAGLAFVVPPLMLLFAVTFGGPVFGAVLGFIWMAIVYALVGDPVSALAKPRRLLEDLLLRSAVPGSSGARTLTWWSLAWGTAQGVTYAACGAAYFALVAMVVMNTVGSRLGSGSLVPDANGMNQVAIILTLLLAISRAVADAVALILLSVITVEISGNQRARERWVLSGLGGRAAAGGDPAAGGRPATSGRPGGVTGGPGSGVGPQRPAGPVS